MFRSDYSFFFLLVLHERRRLTHTAFLKRERKGNIGMILTKGEPDLTSALKFHLRTALPIKLARTNVVNITNVQHLTFNRTLPHLLKELSFYLSVYTSAFCFVFLRLRLFFSQENKQKKKKKAVRV